MGFLHRSGLSSPSIGLPGSPVPSLEFLVNTQPSRSQSPQATNAPSSSPRTRQPRWLLSGFPRLVPFHEVHFPAHPPNFRWQENPLRGWCYLNKFRKDSPVRLDWLLRKILCFVQSPAPFMLLSMAQSTRTWQGCANLFFTIWCSLPPWG